LLIPSINVPTVSPSLIIPSLVPSVSTTLLIPSLVPAPQFYVSPPHVRFFLLKTRFTFPLKCLFIVFLSHFPFHLFLFKLD
jgi:hypothetical protein